MSPNKKYFPIFIDLSDKPVVIVGGGKIATRRAKALASFTGNLTVLAPEVTEELEEMEAEGLLKLIRKPYERELILDACMVLACTNDPKLNKDIYVVCRCLGIQVNVCSDKELCDFYFPGIVEDDQVVVGVTASGTDHKLAKRVTEVIRQALKEKK